MTMNKDMKLQGKEWRDERRAGKGRIGGGVMRASTPQHPKHTGEEHSACSVYWCQGKRGRSQKSDGRDARVRVREARVSTTNKTRARTTNNESISNL